MTLIPIGRFAQASRLSAKSLRNHDRSGLLPAAFVDPDSGYRYYRLQQLPRARAIRTLRLLEVPVAELAAILDGDDPDAALASHLDSLHRQRDAYEQKALQLRRLMDRKDLTMSHDVTVKILEPERVAAWRTTASYEEVFTAIPTGFGAVLGHLDAVGITPVGAPTTVFHAIPDADTDGDVEMCVPIGTPIEDAEPVRCTELAGGPVATVIHRGPYDDMEETYAAVFDWIEARGHHQVGSHREVYLNHPDDVATDELLTEIRIPIDADTD